MVTLLLTSSKESHESTGNNQGNSSSVDDVGNVESQGNLAVGLG